MKKETVSTNDTVKKLKSLLSSFNSINSNIDIYSKQIKKTLNEKFKT